MGCASSAPIVPPGGVVSPEAPPYELKNAADMAENAEDSVADKIKNTVGNMTQDTMSQFVGGANQLKEEAMSKIHDFGESMKDKMESVVDEVEDKLESTFGSIGSKADKEMEEAKQAMDEMADTVDDTKESIEEKKVEIIDDMEKELDTMVEDLEESLPRAPTATPPRIDSPKKECHRRTPHGNIGSYMVSPTNEAFDELELFRNEIMYNTNFMFDLLIFKSQYLEIFTFPTLETLTEKSEECFSNGAKSLNITEDNEKNRLTKFISSESTKDSSSMISFQMESNGERPVSQRTASRTSSLGAEVQITITDITNEHDHYQQDTTKMDELSEKAGMPTHYLSTDDSTTYSSKEITKYSMSVTPKLDPAESEINNLVDKLLPTGSVDSRASNLDSQQMLDSQQITDQNNLCSQSEQSSKHQSSSAETETTFNENNLQGTINSSFQILNDSPSLESEHNLKSQTPINVFQNTSLSSSRLSAQTNKEEELVEDKFNSPVLSEAHQTETGKQSQSSKHSEISLPSAPLESEILSRKSSAHSKQNIESEIIQNDNKIRSSRPGSELKEFIKNTSDNLKMSRPGSQKSRPGSEKARPGSEKSRPGSQTSTKSTKSKTNSRPTSRHSVHSGTFQTSEIDSVHSPHNMKENISKTENNFQTTQLDLSKPDSESFNKEISTEKVIKSSLSRPQSNKSKHSFDNKEHTETSPNISRVSSGKSITKLSTPLLNEHVHSPVLNEDILDKEISSSPLNNGLTQGNSPIYSNNDTQSQAIDHFTATKMEEYPTDDNIIRPEEKEDSAISSTSISPESAQQNLEGQTPVQELIGVT